MNYEPHFNGVDYTPKRDHSRLNTQSKRIFECMKDKKWRTLSEIAQLTGDPEASISAQLRHLTKKRHGGHTKNRSYAGNGLYIYQIIPTAQQIKLFQ